MIAPQRKLNRARSAERIRRDIETLSGPDYTLSAEAIRRYVYTQVYQSVLRFPTSSLNLKYQQPECTPQPTNRRSD